MVTREGQNGWFDSAKLVTCDKCHGEGKVRAPEIQQRATPRIPAVLKAAFVFGVLNVIVAVARIVLLVLE